MCIRDRAEYFPKGDTLIVVDEPVRLKEHSDMTFYEYSESMKNRLESGYVPVSYTHLAGGQGSRLGVLTSKVAKPAVAFGGKYRIIDFPLSNCINSGIDTVGVLTQYQPLRLNTHIGIGIPWDLDRNVGGVSVLPPYEKSQNSEWYTGTANAIYQNLEYMEQYNPEYVLILSGDHIYKMDYKIMLDYHKANNADITIAAMPVPIEEARDVYKRQLLYPAKLRVEVFSF